MIFSLFTYEICDDGVQFGTFGICGLPSVPDPDGGATGHPPRPGSGGGTPGDNPGQNPSHPGGECFG